MALSDVGPPLAKCPPLVWAKDASRERRQRLLRSRTLNLRRISREDANELFEPNSAPIEVARPKTRADCANVPRPCPFVGCRHHLYLDVSERTGNLKFNFPEHELEDMKDTCALDIADDGVATLERVGEAMNLTKERVRQIEEIGNRKMKIRLPVWVREDF